MKVFKNASSKLKPRKKLVKYFKKKLMFILDHQITAYNKEQKKKSNALFSSLHISSTVKLAWRICFVSFGIYNISGTRIVSV